MIQFWRYGFDFYFNWVATLSPQKRSSERVPNRCWQIDFSDTCHGPVAGFGFGRFHWENPKVSNGCGPKLCRCFQRIGVVSWLLRHTTFSCKPNLAMGKWKNRSFVQVEKMCLEISWDPSQEAAAMDIGYKPFPRCTHVLLQHGDFPTSYRVSLLDFNLFGKITMFPAKLLSTWIEIFYAINAALVYQKIIQGLGFQHVFISTLKVGDVIIYPFWKKVSISKRNHHVGFPKHSMGLVYLPNTCIVNWPYVGKDTSPMDAMGFMTNTFLSGCRP